nr:MAG TPA: hypothetical protein [Caudoviricetes sp.]
MYIVFIVIYICYICNVCYFISYLRCKDKKKFSYKQENNKNSFYFNMF